MMKIKSSNPWHVDVCGIVCVTCGVQERMHEIKQSTDVDWLRSVVAFPDNGKTVQQAAERRLRKLTSMPKA